MKKFNQYPLSHAIKKILAVGVSSLMFTSSNVWAEIYGKNPNDIRVSLSIPKICTLDFDRDGDLDIVYYYNQGRAITLQENIGSLSAPLFLPQKLIVDNIYSDEHPIEALNTTDQDCELQHKKNVEIDIDHDGDLDLFKGQTFFGKAGITSPFEFYEQTDSDLKKSNHIFGLPPSVITLAFVDIDGDGDDDVFVFDFVSKGEVFYINTGTPQQASFVQQENPLKCENEKVNFDLNSGGRPEGVIFDLNGDQKPDRICKDKTIILSSQNGYIKNDQLFQDSPIHFDKTYKSPILDIDQDGSPDVEISFDIYSRVSAIRNINNGMLIFPSNREANYEERMQCSLNNKALMIYAPSPFIDFDGDKDLDFFLFDKSLTRSVYCENTGTIDLPTYSPGVDLPGFTDIGIGKSDFVIGDMNGDGDQDLYVLARQPKFYDNIGSLEQPIFKHISHIPMASHSWLDLDNDGQIDSTLMGNGRVLNKSLEPVTGIAVKTYTAHSKINSIKHLIIAVNRPSQVQLYKCYIHNGRCNQPIVLPNTAKEIALSIGNFIHTAELDGDELALAMIDEQGLINLNIYDTGFHDDKLKLISQGQGGQAHSISMSAGQLDSDPEDEVALTFIQENGKVLSTGVNFDMSIVGSAQQGVGKNPSVAVGKFSDTSGSYVMTYITPDNQLNIATIQGDGTIISQIDGGSASDAKVSKATFVSSTSQDEYIVSTRSPDGIAGLTGFTSNGNILGQLTGEAVQQPTVISRYSSTGESLGLVVSLIQADKKPAVIFLDNQGNILAAGVGGKTAMVATVADGGNGNAILAYVDEDGIPRWETFAASGVKQP